jgi:hypothetical protein
VRLRGLQSEGLKAMSIRIDLKLMGLWRRWRSDNRGTSMLTSAVTLPLLIIILFGIWYLFWWLTVKQSFHMAVQDAAREASEFGRYWEIDPLAADPTTLLPSDYYEQRARRVILQRLKDTGNWPSRTLSNALLVRVEEPPLAVSSTATTSGTMVIQEGFIDSLCDQGERDVGEDYRLPENIRLRVYAQLSMPIMPVRIPWMDQISVTLKDRAIGYVQCPRWMGQRDGAVEDQSEWLAPEYPAFPYRFPATAVYPTITPPVAPTNTPTTTLKLR